MTLRPQLPCFLATGINNLIILEAKLPKPIFQKLRPFGQIGEIGVFIFHLPSIDLIFIEIPDPNLITSVCSSLSADIKNV
jgi:hypothetical protein